MIISDELGMMWKWSLST